ncbi:MAG: class I SAM-dependent methyltransferase [Candidatus Kariarchaeaceae archaeon]
MTESETAQFMDTVYSDFKGAMATLMFYIGDELGLFKDLLENGPAKPQNLAKRLGYHVRYVEEWLKATFAAGYLHFSPYDNKYSLPEAYASVLAVEPNLNFTGAFAQQFGGLIGVTDLVINSFRNGGGVTQDHYPHSWWKGMERETNNWYQFLLVDQWIPQINGLEAKLKQGITVADVGCGYGKAILRMANEYPNSTFYGYDVHGPSIEAANSAAKEIGLENAIFEVLDFSEGLPMNYDFITAFDVLHDMVDPKSGLEMVQRYLNKGGDFMILEYISSDKPEENRGIVPTIMYGFSVMYCLTVSLAENGTGLGTLGLNPKLLNEYSENAGFKSFSQLETDDPLNGLFLMKN